MIGIVLVSHGTFADGLRNAAEMIIGPQERLLAVGMRPGVDARSLRREIEAAARQVGEKHEVLILVDLLGGNPATTSSLVASGGTEVICGVNLPMLLEILTQRDDSTLEEITSMALEAAREGIIHLTQR